MRTRTWLGLVSVVLGIALSSFPTAAATTLTLSVTPRQIDRGEPFVVTVSTGFPNVTVLVLITDTHGTEYRFQNQTNALGIWTLQVGFVLTFGHWNILAESFNAAGNVTASASDSLDVICGGACIAETLNGGLFDYGNRLQDAYTRLVIGIVFLILMFEIPKMAWTIYRVSDEARRQGKMTIREYVTAPFQHVKTFIAPARQGILPRANDRIAVDVRRRELMDELHRATDMRFREYDPRQVTIITSMVKELETTTERERLLSIRRPPIHHVYEPRIAFDSTSTETQLLAVDQFIDEGKGETMEQRVERAKGNVRSSNRAIAAGIVFGLVGIPGIVMVVLGQLAYAGIYFEPARSLWQPWFGDVGKFFIGMAMFLTTFAYFLYAVGAHRRRRSKGVTPS